ncbi:MAG: porin, partial [Aquitalea sp.]|nr:porin [Aquitalea sp.]
MNKKLIAVALAALPVAHAMADVTIYGTIAADIQNGKTYDGQASSGKKSATRIDDAGSSIGFKGTEDLGNGLKAIWQVEQGLNIDGTSGSSSANGYSGNLASRDSFVGLQGSFGKVRLGRLSTFQNSDTETYDAWTYAGNADKTVAGMTYMSGNWLDGRHNNAIRYDLPEVVAGLSGAVLYSADENRSTGTNGARTNTQFWSLGAAYTNSGFFVNGGYNNY